MCMQILVWNSVFMILDKIYEKIKWLVKWRLDTLSNKEYLIFVCYKNIKYYLDEIFYRIKFQQWQNCSISSLCVAHTFNMCVNGKLYTNKNVSIILFLRLDISIPFYNRFSHFFLSSNILFKVFIISCLWPKRYDIKILLKLNI